MYYCLPGFDLQSTLSDEWERLSDFPLHHSPSDSTALAERLLYNSLQKYLSLHPQEICTSKAMPLVLGWTVWEKAPAPGWGGWSMCGMDGKLGSQQWGCWQTWDLRAGNEVFPEKSIFGKDSALPSLWLQVATGSMHSSLMENNCPI